MVLEHNFCKSWGQICLLSRGTVERWWWWVRFKYGSYFLCPNISVFGSNSTVNLGWTEKALNLIGQMKYYVNEASEIISCWLWSKPSLYSSGCLVLFNSNVCIVARSKRDGGVPVQLYSTAGHHERDSILTR